MQTLRSALDELASLELSTASDDDLEASLVELERASATIEAERARRVAEVARRGAFRRDGFLSATSWLAARLRISGGAAARYVRWSRVLRRADVTRRALAAGDLSLSAAAALIDAAEADPENYRRDESLLVRAARSLAGRDLARAISYWRQHVDAESADADERAFARRRLHVSATLDGMVRLDGDLDRETGQVVMTALRSVLDGEARGTGTSGDVRTPAQRRADALGEVCRRYLDDSDRPMVAGERPHVLVVADAESLNSHGPTETRNSKRGRAPFERLARAELADAGSVSTSDLRRLACDASITRVITRAGSEPLDVGRRTPVVPPGMRRALIVRDGRCRFPGCDRPHGWCDAHHVTHWADGGETSVGNLILLCRRHHRLVHRGFSITIGNREVVFRRPDGTVLAAQRLAGRPFADGSTEAVLTERAPP